MPHDGFRLDRRALGAAAFFVVCTLALCWPVLLAPSARIAMDTGDPALNAAILYWNATTIPLTAAWWNFPAFAPATDATAFTEHLLGFWPLASPIAWLTHDPVVTYNAVFLLTLPLSALAMFALVRTLTGSTAGAVVAGLAFAFAPYRASQLSHVQMLAAYGMPLALLGLHRFRETRRMPALVLFGAGWLVTVLTNSYMLVFFGVYVACWTLWFCTGRETRSALPWIAAAGLVSLIVLAPILVTYVEVHDLYGFTRPDEEIVGFSADLTGLAHAWPDLPVTASWLAATRGEGAIFPGLTIALLAVGAIAAARRSGGARGTGLSVAFYAVMTVVTWLLSLGPIARLDGVAIASGLPYNWLLVVPGVDGLRVPARFWMLSTLSLAVLAGYGAASLARLRAGRALVALAAALILAEGWVHVIAAPVEATAAVQPEESGTTVLELPFAGTTETAAPEMLRAVTAGYRTLNGHSGFLPAHMGPLQVGLTLGDGSILTELRRRVSLHVSVRADDADGWRTWLLATQPDAMLVADSGGRALFRLPPLALQPPAPAGVPVPFAVVAVSCATEPVSHVADGSLDTRWHCGAAAPGQSLAVRLEQTTSVSGVVLRAGPYWRDLPRSLRIEVSSDGEEWHEVWSNLPASAALAAALDRPGQLDVPLLFPPVDAQYVRLTQTGDAWEWYWSIAELQVLSDGAAARF